MRRIQGKGVALITVMLVVALAAIIATQMLARLQLQVQRTTNINFNQQAYWYAMGAEAFAKRVLFTAFNEEKDVTHLGQMWAQGKTTYPVDYGEISGEITDLQACFNLNALRSQPSERGQNKKAPARLAFEELLIALNIDEVDEFSAEYMADALTDWLDSDSSIVSAGGAEDNDYAAKAFPYFPANNYLASVNELRVIEHFSLPVIQALKDYVCVIPNNNLYQVNINTLSQESPEILQAILSMSREDAEQALSAREEDGFKDLNAFFELPEIKTLKLTEEQKQRFVVDSEYFKLKATANFNNSYFQLNSTLYVADNNKISVISRTIGRD
ncbi:type II secretion system minor pseudopilin GspK [Colwellia sp. 1_MG-2023]|uniref:type II secretion system minor pseudopilin GspK n=1 Tax=Colwellia sp. 1_MG-2023 TaxID=3062649 RepID=UPI0026E2700A|nr:type II secretion system minor pseudopilin GspK [Colwellia sp. 1_MG-2023]MDO6447437.1 type II secretion system minor pseudopilin GspK [Colwellia sp. 1_MG-2023]